MKTEFPRLSLGAETALRGLAWISLVSFTDVFSASAIGAILIAYPLACAGDRERPALLRLTSAACGPLAAIAVLLATGAPAAALASAWLGYTLLNAAYGLIRYANAPRHSDTVAAVELLGYLGPVIGAAAWVASRAGLRLAGFDEPIVTLTVTHFHFVFGALPFALATATRHLAPADDTGARATGSRTLLGLFPACAVATGIAFALRNEPARAGITEAITTTLMAAALIGWFTLAIFRRTGRERATLALAGLLLAPGAALGAAWAITLATETPFLSFAGMARTHGMLNALGTLALITHALRLPAATGNAAPIPDPTKPENLSRPAGRFAFRDDVLENLGGFTPAKFEGARRRLLDYDFYPPEVMEHRTAWREAGRPPRLGDAIGMRLLVPILPGLPPLRFPAMTRLHAAVDTPAFAALGYRTTTRHYGRGEWLAELSHDRENIRLRIRSVITPAHPLALLGLPLYRFLQLRARRRAIETFRGELENTPLRQ